MFVNVCNIIHIMETAFSGIVEQYVSEETTLISG